MSTRYNSEAMTLSVLGIVFLFPAGNEIIYVSKTSRSDLRPTCLPVQRRQVYYPEIKAAGE